MIRAENLSKRYRIGGRKAAYSTLRESLIEGVHTSVSRFSSIIRGKASRIPGNEGTIWALKEVSFEVKQGETLGIIGQNGAGKTTLLKILSRITKPTSGQVTLRGRVGSLLEVGTGFHPELTGRENIYLNGAILGMHRNEIERKFDEIVDFSEIEKFLDTPVKHYSSGMYMRLAFAVAAHLDPEILLVDEVLAVGDVSFQKKCLGKMGQVANYGRTVLFVSHNMDAITRLCKTSILLKSGDLDSYGPSHEVVAAYINSIQANGNAPFWVNQDPSEKRIKFIQVSLTPEEIGSITCYIEYSVNSDAVGSVIAIRIDSISGAPVMTLTDNDLDEGRFIKKKGVYRASCSFPTNLLTPGLYRIAISAADMKGTRYDYHEGVLSFEVLQSPVIKPSFRREGPLLLPADWNIREVL